MSKHTEGPWHVEVDKSNPSWPEIRIWSGEVGQWLLLAHTQANKACDRETTLANMRLMAAAPDLLAALEDLLPSAEKEIERLISQMVGGLYPAINAARIERARAAIAKAKGGAA